MVQAGTGTGKSLAYLVPAICSGRRVVVATATKALQDQLVKKDLPFLERHLDRPFTFTCLKGRANYLCVQRAREATEAAAGGDQLDLADGTRDTATTTREQIRRLIGWASEQLDGDGTGDRAELTFEPSPAAWSAVSVSSRECPGANHCPAGDVCFAERARDAAAVADVVVVNTHLYGTHLAAGGGVLPEHDVVVVDEAHVLADVISATAGLEIAATRFIAVAGALRGILADDQLVAAVADAGTGLSDALYPLERQRITAIEGELSDAITVGRSRLDRALAALRQIGQLPPHVAPRKERALRLASSLIDDLVEIVDLRETRVAWVEPGPPTAGSPVLRQAPIDVRAALAPLFDHETVVLTSATLTDTLPDRLGMPPDRTSFLDVGSPFDFRTNARLYCAVHLPDPRSDAYEQAMHDELAVLIDAAGGRTLALFTSWKRMRSAVDAVRTRVAVPDPGPGRPAQARAGRRLRRGRGDVSVRHDGLLAGHRRSRTIAVVGVDRSAAVHAARRPAGAGEAGGGRPRLVHPRRRAPGGDDAGPGHGPADPHRRGPGGRRRAGPPARHRQLSPADPRGPAPDAPARRSERGGRVPALDHHRRVTSGSEPVR